MELFELIKIRAISEHLGKIGVPNITIMKYNLRNLSVTTLQVVSQVFDMLIKVHPGQAQSMKVTLIH